MCIKDLIGVLEIVSKYVDTSKEYVNAGHDVIVLPLDIDFPIDPSDCARLIQLGAHQSTEYGCWSFFT